MQILINLQIKIIIFRIPLENNINKIKYRKKVLNNNIK